MERIAATVSRERIAAGPALALALPRLPALRARRTSTPACPAGMTPLVRAPRLAEAPGPARRVGEERHREPDPQLQGPGGLGRAREGQAARLQRGRLRLHRATWPTRSPPTPSAHGLESYVFVPADLEEQKIVATAVYGTTLLAVDGNYDDVNRLCMELASDRPWAFVNVNVRPYYSEGSKTLAYEVAEQLGWTPARPLRRPDRLRVALHQDQPRLPRPARDRAWSRARCRCSTARRPPGCGPVAAAFEAGPRLRRARCGRTPSPRAWPSATRPTASSPWTWRARPAARISSVTEEEIVEGIELLAAHHRDLHRDGRRRHHGHPGQARRAPGRSTPTSAWSLYITGDGLKTLDAVADRVERHPIEPTVASFEAAMGEARLVA